MQKWKQLKEMQAVVVPTNTDNKSNSEPPLLDIPQGDEV